MVLADTSIWISHFRRIDPHLSELLSHGWVACHPFVIGELACGNLERRAEILGLLHDLPGVEVAENDEILEFIERRSLWGSGLGLVDMHLLASARLTHLPLWTGDKHLRAAARALSVAYE